MTERPVPTIFCKRRRQLRHQRAARLQRTGSGADYLCADMVEDILDRVDFMRLPEGRAFIIGELTNLLSPALNARGIETLAKEPDSYDEERPTSGSRIDYIISLGTLDTLNDLPGALIHYRNALDHGGILFAQIIGAGSLPALRQIMFAADADRTAARLHPQIDDRAATALLQRAGFSRQVVDSRRLTVRFSSFERMIADLREQALTSVLASPAPYIGKAGLARARAAFEAMRDADGKVSEAFEILTLTGWR